MTTIIIVVVILIDLITIGIAMTSGGPSRYPDGKCYLCRKGWCYPGETCHNCGAKQPD